MRISKIDKILFSMFACWCLVDSINGFLLREGFASLSQVYKLIVSFILIARCKELKRVMNFITALSLYLGFYLSIVALNDEEIGPSLILISKPLTSLLFFMYFSKIAKCNGDFFMQNFIKVIKWNFVFFLINMLLGIIGVGYHAYDDGEGIGGIGFFYAANELSGLVAAIFPWIFYYVKRNYSITAYFLSGGVLLVLAYTLSAKAGILATLMSFVLITFLFGEKKERRIALVLTVFALGYAIYHIQNLLGIDSAIIQRFSYNLDKDGVMNAITSDRLIYWEEAKREFYDAGFISKMFGIGGSKTVEMDPYDAMLNCGYFGLFFLILVYIKALIEPLKRSKRHLPYGKVIFTSNLILVIISIIGGHVLFSSMSGMLIALSNAMLFMSPNLQYMKNADTLYKTPQSNHIILHSV